MNAAKKVLKQKKSTSSAGNEIDDIFATKKKELGDKANASKKQTIALEKTSKRKDDDFGDIRGTGKTSKCCYFRPGLQLIPFVGKTTTDGLSILTATTELQLDKDAGGDTELCPFDCKCCK